MELLFAWLLGCLGGAWHLAVVAWRAHRLQDSLLAAVLLAPLGLLGPLAAAGAALAISPPSVWAVLVGLVCARLALVGPLGRRLEEGPWTS